jgi:hypothetical protein
VPVSVCLEEEALGTLSPRSSSSRICVSQGEGVCKQQHSMHYSRLPRPALLGHGSGDQPFLLGATPEPHQAVVEPRCINSTHVLVWVCRAPLSR